MEKIHNIKQSVSSAQVEIRVVLIIAGIATAIICAMALLYEVRSINSEAINFINTPHVVPTELPAKMVNKIIVSAVWPF